MAAADTPSDDGRQGLTESEVEALLASVEEESGTEYSWSHWRSSPRFSCWKQERDEETAMIQVGGEMPILCVDDYEEQASVTLFLGSREKLVEALALAAAAPEAAYQKFKSLRDKPFVVFSELPVPDDPTGADMSGMLARQAAWDDRRFDSKGGT